MQTYPGQTYPPLIEPTAIEANYTNITYWTMHTYPGQMYPPSNRTESYRGQLHQVTMTYGTIHIYPQQMYLPSLSQELQSPTTPGMYNIFQNADIPMADVHPF